MAAPKTGPTAPKKIDPDQVRNLASKHWSTEQIAAHFHCSRDTIERHFLAIIKEAKHSGTAKIIDMLLQRAEVSDRILEHIANRFIGPIPQKVELTHEELVELNKKALSAEPETDSSDAAQST